MVVDQLGDFIGALDAGQVGGRFEQLKARTGHSLGQRPPCSGGRAGPGPAMTSVGAVMPGISGRRSIPAIASQQPA